MSKDQLRRLQSRSSRQLEAGIAAPGPDGLQAASTPETVARIPCLRQEFAEVRVATNDVKTATPTPCHMPIAHETSLLAAAGFGVERGEGAVVI